MDIKLRLQNVFKDVFGDEDIDIYPELSTTNNEDWDSLTHIQLILSIEKEFNIKFTTNEVMQTNNFSDFIKLIEEKSMDY